MTNVTTIMAIYLASLANISTTDFTTALLPSTPKLPDTTTSLRPSTPKLPDTTTPLRPSTPKLPDTTTSLRPSTPKLPDTTTSLRPSTPKLPDTTTSLRPSTPKLPDTTRAITECNILEGGEYIFNVSSRKVGTIRRVDCVENYFRSGDAVIRCNPDGHWSSHPICQRMCRLLRGKYVVLSEYNRTYGSLVNAACKDGYKLIGSPDPPNPLLCTTDAFWNGTLPICRADNSDTGMPVGIIVVIVLAIVVVLVILGLVLFMLMTNVRRDRAIKRQEEQFREEIINSRNFQAVTQDAVGMPAVNFDSLHPTLKGHPDKEENQNGTTVKEDSGGASLQKQDEKMKSMMY